MGRVEERLESLGYELSGQAAPVANYVPAVFVEDAGLLFTSGHVPRNPDGSFMTGRLGNDVSVEYGYEAAKATALALLGTVKAEVGDLDPRQADREGIVHGQQRSWFRGPAVCCQRGVRPAGRSLRRGGSACPVRRRRSGAPRQRVRRSRDVRGGLLDGETL